MIPNQTREYTLVSTKKPNKTYYLDPDTGRITGFLYSGEEAVKQAAFLILNTERCQHEVYSWNYGIELKDLIGQPAELVESELKRRVYEALTQDERIVGVDNFRFEKQQGAMRVLFAVSSQAGSFDYDMEVKY